MRFPQNPLFVNSHTRLDDPRQVDYDNILIMVGKLNSIEVLTLALHSAILCRRLLSYKRILDGDGLEVEFIFQLLEARVREDDSGYYIRPLCSEP